VINTIVPALGTTYYCVCNDQPIIEIDCVNLVITPGGSCFSADNCVPLPPTPTPTPLLSDYYISCCGDFNVQNPPYPGIVGELYISDCDGSYWTCIENPIGSVSGIEGPMTQVPNQTCNDILPICNQYTITNNSLDLARFYYIDCGGNLLFPSINPSSQLVICGCSVFAGDCYPAPVPLIVVNNGPCPTPTPTPTETPTPTPTSVGCTCLQGDSNLVSLATGNTNPSLNNIVEIFYTDCDGKTQTYTQTVNSIFYICTQSGIIDLVSFYQDDTLISSTTPLTNPWQPFPGSLFGIGYLLLGLSNYLLG
jgi:hypothetical protein